MRWVWARPRFELDGTPEPDHLFSNLWAVEICPDCGYVSFDIDEGDERIRKVVLSGAYQAQYRSPSLPSWLPLGALLTDPEDIDYHGKRCYWELLAAWNRGSGDEARSHVVGSPQPR